MNTATATPEAAAEIRGGSMTPVDALSATGVGGLTLAELQAVVAIAAPGQLGRMQPLLALVPLLAQRRSIDVNAVYAMPAGDVFDGGMAVVAGVLTDEAVAAAQVALQQAWAAVDPDRLRRRMTSGL